MFLPTETQVRVLLLLEKGRSNSEIARALSLNVAGVEYHLARLLKLTGASNRVALALWWREYRSANH
jgi:DNA-binding CsgD family transcriptional regulator